MQNAYKKPVFKKQHVDGVFFLLSAIAIFSIFFAFINAQYHKHT